MAIEITMPRLSDSMEQGIVLSWLAGIGDEVSVGQELVEVETDKATMIYEAESAGTLLSIIVAAGETAAVGSPIAVVGSPGEAAPTSALRMPPGDAAVSVPVAPPIEPVARDATAVGVPPAGNDNGAASRAGRLPATPVARRLAAAHGVDLAPLTGTGPNGRLVKLDIMRAVAELPDTPPEPLPAAPTPDLAAEASKGSTAITELSRLQQLVARRMAEARATVPDFELRVDVDMAASSELRARLKAIADPAPSFNDMIIKASAIALREHTRANASYSDGRFELYSRINVGFAVAANDALVVPTVFDADRASLGEVARTTRALAAKVRDGSINPPELAGGTFTVSNLGMFGIDSFSAVINAPQAAILAVGAIRKRAVVVDDDHTIAARPMMTLALSADHRILYGADAARLLARIRELLEGPLAITVL